MTARIESSSVWASASPAARSRALATNLDALADTKFSLTTLSKIDTLAELAIAAPGVPIGDQQFVAALLKPDPQTALQAPAYPVDALGGILGSAARAIADGYQLDPAIAGQSVLAAAFVVCQHGADVETASGRKPISNNLLTCALSGDGKTTADGPALAPIRDIEKIAYAKYEIERGEWESLPKKERGDKPINPLILVSDFTAEGLVRQFREGRSSLGAFSDEAGAVFGGHGFSAERKLMTAAGLSSLWDGAGIRARARASDDRGGLEAKFDVRLSSHWLIQPAAVNEAVNDPILGEQGFWPRVLIATPPAGKPRFYRPFDASTSPAIRVYWERLQARIESSPDGRHLVTSTPAAQEMVAGFFVAIDKASRGHGGKYSPIRAWGARATEHLLRVAAALAVFERGFNTTIEGDEIERAALIVKHSLDCWLYLLEASPEDSAKAYAARLLKWLKEQPNGQSNETAMLRIGPKPRSASLRDSALAILEGQNLVVSLNAKRWATREL